jgi:hypothetical protein
MLADDDGVHFEGGDDEDIVVYWGEIESVWAVRWQPAEGNSLLEISLNHITGVDFNFVDVEGGYAEVMAAMEKHLAGFSREAAESAPIFEKEQDIRVVWKRDPISQPFELHPLPVTNRPPTEQEASMVKAAHKASIATCEKLLGRALTADEKCCIYTGFENGRIAGNIAPPLSEMLQKRQAELNELSLRSAEKDSGRTM